MRKVFLALGLIGAALFVGPLGRAQTTPEPGLTCGAHGKAVNGACTCDAGWGGGRCLVAQGTNCGHGQAVNGVCQCEAGWSGGHCMLQAASGCGVHGTAQNGACVCEAGWSGARCLRPPGAKR